MITLRMLRGACAGQKRLFRSEWPAGAEATLENVLRAQELGLDLPWGADHLFTPEARAEYQRQSAPLWAEYERQMAPIRAERKRQEAPIWAERDRQMAPIWLAAFLASRGGQG